MPRRTPIIPGIAGSSQLLRSVHHQHTSQKPHHHDHHSSSSGIHSNSSDNCDTYDRRHRMKMGYDNNDGEDITSSSGPDDDVSDEDNYNDDMLDESEDDSDDSSEQEDRNDRYEMETVWAAKLSRNSNVPFINSKGSGYRNNDQRAIQNLRSGNRRFSGPQSYVRARDNDEEIEIIERKHQVRLRHGNGEAKRTKEYQEKRRSDTAIEYMIRRRNQLNEIKKRSEDGEKRAAPVHIRRQRSASGTKDFKHHKPVTSREQDVLVAAIKARFEPENGQQKKPPQTVAVKNIQKKKLESSDTDIELNLKSNSSSKVDLNYEKARSLERQAKRRTKALKQNIVDAKLDVKEAQLGEFAIKLRTRHAQIEEKHAKLCRRRMALKKAEEDLDALEANLDEQEEEHRGRERKIKNRDRRVKQEEAGLKIKEDSLKKREIAISENLALMEKRRQIVEQKEETANKMSEVLSHRETLHGQSVNHYIPPKQKSKSRSGLGKLITRKNKDKNEKPGQDKSNGKMISSAPKTTSSVPASNKNYTLPRSSKLSQNEPSKPQRIEQEKYHTLDKKLSPKHKSKPSTAPQQPVPVQRNTNQKSNVMGWWI